MGNADTSGATWVLLVAVAIVVAMVSYNAGKLNWDRDDPEAARLVERACEVVPMEGDSVEVFADPDLAVPAGWIVMDWSDDSESERWRESYGVRLVNPRALGLMVDGTFRFADTWSLELDCYPGYPWFY